MPKLLQSIAGAALCTLMPATAQVDAARPALAAACVACHGTQGLSPSDTVPNLAGQKKGYLAAQLQAFRSGERKHELMGAIARQLAPADIDALAGYWSAQAAVASSPPRVAAVASRMPFPSDFPRGFAEYEQSVEAADRVLVKRYANATAWAAARAGDPLPHGSVLISVTHALEGDAAKPVAGAVRAYAGMASQAGWGAGVPALLRNGDWDYALFDAQGTRREGLNQADCLACHQPKAADSFVFTWSALRRAAQR